MLSRDEHDFPRMLGYGNIPDNFHIANLSLITGLNFSTSVVLLIDFLSNLS